jgi:multimeric flavodoxin WrbA
MDKIRLLGISGSPRPRGNSRYLLEVALEAATELGSSVETEVYSIGGKGKSFAPCDSCYSCVRTGECRIKDSFQELRDKWLAADVIIYSVPVYHMTYPAQLRAFIDRLGNHLFGYYGGRISKHLKAIGIIAQGSHLFSGQEHTITDLVNHALIMGCIPVAGDIWESYIGVGGWTENDSRNNAIAKLFEEGSKDAQVTVRASRSLGKRTVQVAMIVKCGALANADLLRADGGFDAFYRRIRTTWREK